MDMILHISRYIACVVADLLDRGGAGAEQEVGLGCRDHP